MAANPASPTIRRGAAHRPSFQTSLSQVYRPRQPTATLLYPVAYHPDPSEHLVFKGGTRLRKCYFPEYGVSEDLDFTATRWAGWEEIERTVQEGFITQAITRVPT